MSVQGWEFWEDRPDNTPWTDEEYELSEDDIAAVQAHDEREQRRYRQTVQDALRIVENYLVERMLRADTDDERCNANFGLIAVRSELASLARCTCGICSESRAETEH